MKSVAVIGAGVIGLSAADELLDRGYRVTVIDRGQNPHLRSSSPQEELGCSYGNGGLIVPSHFVPLAAPGMAWMGLKMMANRASPFGVAGLGDLQTLSWMTRFALAGTRKHVERCAPLLRDLNLASREIYAERAKEMDFDLAQTGILMLSLTHRAHDAEARLSDRAQSLGLETQVLDGEAVQALEPDAEVTCAGGVLFKDDAKLSPDSYMRGLWERVADRGATIMAGVEARSFLICEGGIRSVETNKGPVEADEFVLAGGAWSSDLAKTAGLKIPMRAGRGYGLTIPNPPQPLRMPSILTEARVAVTPLSNGVRFVGTFELTKPVLRDSSPRADGMKNSVASYYPAFTPGVLDQPLWCGLRPCSPDGMPYLGRTRRAKNLIVATAHAMMGMSLGPISGRLVAQLVGGEPPCIPLDLLSPDRYD